MLTSLYAMQYIPKNITTKQGILLLIYPKKNFFVHIYLFKNAPSIHKASPTNVPLKLLSKYQILYIKINRNIIFFFKNLLFLIIYFFFLVSHYIGQNYFPLQAC